MQKKNIVLGITGGIAAYKAAELVRLLVKAQANVRVVMTRAATQFITPLTLQTLSQNPVHTDLFDLGDESRIGHISLAQSADIIVIAPASANIIGKTATGIADDLLSTLVTAATAPVLICPAMNDQMWANPIVRDNVARLKKFGYRFLEPVGGELACKTVGVGRLPDPQRIFEEIRGLLSPKPLSGKKMLVSAGPTREFLDDVRFLSNRSSGRMGFALAEAARDLGAEVALISGPTTLAEPHGVRVTRVESAREMEKVLSAEFLKADVLIMAAAVADFRPAKRELGKRPKSEVEECLTLTKNPDIVSKLGKKKGERIVVGFAAQTGPDHAVAREKLRRKNLDFIVFNDVSAKGIGFDAEENEVTILGCDGFIRPVERTNKYGVAVVVLETIFGLNT